jgi:hypothetical protein
MQSHNYLNRFADLAPNSNLPILMVKNMSMFLTNTYRICIGTIKGEFFRFFMYFIRHFFIGEPRTVATHFGLMAVGRSITPGSGAWVGSITLSQTYGSENPVPEFEIVPNVVFQLKSYIIFSVGFSADIYPRYYYFLNWAQFVEHRNTYLCRYSITVLWSYSPPCVPTISRTTVGHSGLLEQIN